MGILGYPNMDDGNRDGMFGDYSDVYSNYSQDEASNGSSVAASEQPSVDMEASVSQEATQGEQQVKKGSPVLFLFITGLLLIAVAGLYLYKKHIDVPTESQALGDYFYNQVQDTKTEPVVAQPQSSESTTLVEVDLGATAPVATKELVVDAKARKAKALKAGEKSDIATQDSLTPIQKAKLKAEADKERENAVSLSNTAVTIPVATGGRIDPFMPVYLAKEVSDVPKFELIAPPIVIPEPDPVVEDLLQTKISGIMYDSARPSAIINIGGEDQLVHKGDFLNGYKILNITKDTVVIQYKANVYNASVGQTLDNGIKLNPSSNIKNSFGGLYSGSGSNVIKINN